MKNTLLALMLVSSLFVISCGADSTKPTDAFKSQKTEVSSGTKIAENVTLSTTVDVANFAKPGEKVTEIVEVNGTGGKGTESNIKKNTDGGIYQFDTTASGNGYITYKYTKSIIAPIVTKTTSVQASSGSITMTDPLFAFEPNVISVKDTQGNNISFNYTDGNTITLYGYTTGSVIVEYQYMDINKISEKPTKATSFSGSQISLTATTDAGKTYVCIINNGAEYLYGIVPADGNISTTTTSGNYELWLY